MRTSVSRCASSADCRPKQPDAMLCLAPRADLAVMHRAEIDRFRDRPEVLARVTPQAYAELYRDAPSIGFEADGLPIGGILFDGRQAHIAVLPEWHGRWALLMKPALAWLFTLRAAIEVEVEAGNERCLRFLDRHGWPRLEGASPGFVRYRLVPLQGTRKTAYVALARCRP